MTTILSAELSAEIQGAAIKSAEEFKRALESSVITQSSSSAIQKLIVLTVTGLIDSTTQAIYANLHRKIEMAVRENTRRIVLEVFDRMIDGKS